MASGFVGGLAVSLLGAILLFLGATGAFASKLHVLPTLSCAEASLLALFAVGAILSLIGTGFLVSVFPVHLHRNLG